MNEAVIGVGSNIEPEKNIALARTYFESEQVFVAESDYVITKPIGFEKQPDFYNGAVRIKTRLEQNELKAWLLNIESKLGRIRTANKYGPRPIDLDIVVWNGTIVDNDFYERDFLQKAVNSIAADILSQNSD